MNVQTFYESFQVIVIQKPKIIIQNVENREREIVTDTSTSGWVYVI